jgi:hypothetical protein
LRFFRARRSTKHHFWTDLRCAWSFELGKFLFYFLRFTTVEVEVVWRYRFPVSQRTQLLTRCLFLLFCHCWTRCPNIIVTFVRGARHFEWIIDTYCIGLNLLKLVRLFYLHWSWLELIKKVIRAKVNVQLFCTHRLYTCLLFSREWKTASGWSLHLYLLYFFRSNRLYCRNINHR